MMIVAQLNQMFMDFLIGAMPLHEVIQASPGQKLGELTREIP